MFDQQSRLQNLIDLLSPFFFHKNRDITLASGRDVYIDETTKYFPAGIIVMWSGAIADIPTGWALCDGTNGTPDLTDRFIIHADADSGGTNNVGDTGGASTIDIQHSHTSGTLATDSDSHSHDVTGTTASDSHNHSSGTLSISQSSHGGHSHVPGGATGSPSANVTVDNNLDGSTITVGSNAHTHTDSNTGVTQIAAHNVDSGSTGSDSHSHGNGTLATDSDGHSHSVDSGSTGNALSTTQSIRDKYYALALIMRL